MIGAAQVVGRPIVTALEPRVSETGIAVVVFALQALALALILAPRGMTVVLVAAALLGVGRGGTTLMRAIAPVGAGLKVSRLGGYGPMLATLMAIAIAAGHGDVRVERAALAARLRQPEYTDWVNV